MTNTSTSKIINMWLIPLRITLLYILVSLNQGRTYSSKVFRGFVIGSFTPDSSYWDTPIVGNQHFTVTTTVPIQNFYGAFLGLQEIQYSFDTIPSISLRFYYSNPTPNSLGVVLYDSLSQRTTSLRLRYLIIDANFNNIGSAVCWLSVGASGVGTNFLQYSLSNIPGYTPGDDVVAVPLIYRINLAYLGVDTYLFGFSFSYAIAYPYINLYLVCTGSSNLDFQSQIYRILFIDNSELLRNQVTGTSFLQFHSNSGQSNIPAQSSSVMFGLSALTFTASNLLKFDSTLLGYGLGLSNLTVTLDASTALVCNAYLYAVATTDCPWDFPFSINSTTCADTCLDSQYIILSTPKVCSPCHPICLTCFATSLNCTTCNLTANRIINVNSCSPITGYYQSGLAMPLPCNPNCTACLNFTFCYACAHNNTLRPNGICRPCSIYIVNCLTCYNTTLCDRCMSGFKLRSYVANQTQCIPVCSVSDCAYCLTSAICLRCLPYFVLQGGQCVSKCGDGVLSLVYEQCDDGNLLNHDGCDSQCRNQTNWACVTLNNGLFLFTGNCVYEGAVKLSVISIKKSSTSNTLFLQLQYNPMQMLFWRSIHLPDILQFSSNGTLFASNISALASDGTFTAECTYSRDMYGSTLTLTTDFTHGSSTVANISIHILNTPIFTLSNQLTHLYSTQYSQAATLFFAYMIISCISIVVLLITFLSNTGKIHAVQAIMWSQFTYCAYIGTKSTSPLIDGMSGLTYSNLYNLRGTDYLFENSSTSAIFLKNYNIGLGVMLLPILLGLLFKLIEKIKAKFSSPLQKSIVNADLDFTLIFPQVTVTIGSLLLNEYALLSLMCCIYPVYCFGVLSIVYYEALDGILVLCLFTMLLTFYLYRYTTAPQDFKKDLYSDSLCAKYYLLLVVVNVINAALLPVTIYPAMGIFCLLLIVLLKYKPFKALKDTGKCISEMVLLMMIGGGMSYVRAVDVREESTLRIYTPVSILGLLFILSGINWVFAARCGYKKLRAYKKEAQTSIDVKGLFKTNAERQALFNQPPLGHHVQKYQELAGMKEQEGRGMKDEEGRGMKDEEVGEVKKDEEVGEVKKEEASAVKKYRRKMVDEYDQIDQL